MTEPVNPMHMLEQMMQQFASNTNSQVSEELVGKGGNSLEEDDSNFLENHSVENSIVSVEEEIPDFFDIDKVRELEKEGLVPKVLFYESIFQEILKENEENEENRDNLLLYLTFYNSEKNIPPIEVLTNLEGKFEEIKRKICWKFHKFLDYSLDSSKEFEKIILDKLVKENNTRLLVYHFLYRKKLKDVKIDDIYNENCLENQYENDKKEYCNVVQSVLMEQFY